MLLLAALAPAAAVRIVPGAAPRLSTPHMVATVPQPAAAGASPENAAAEGELVAAITRALDDKRRVDELVTLFEYNARVECGGERFDGHGAVKRFFANLLFEGGAVRVDGEAAAAAGGGTALRLRSDDGDGDGARGVTLRATLGAAGAPGFDEPRIAHLAVDLEASGAVVPTSSFDVFGTSGDPSTWEGPKWETFDGRVRQKIWAEAGLFEAGNTFLVEKMELTEGRLIVIVDLTVWELYGDQMRT